MPKSSIKYATSTIPEHTKQRNKFKSRRKQQRSNKLGLSDWFTEHSKSRPLGSQNRSISGRSPSHAHLPSIQQPKPSLPAEDCKTTARFYAIYTALRRHASEPSDYAGRVMRRKGGIARAYPIMVIFKLRLKGMEERRTESSLSMIFG
jgi:hypothetical protein